MMIPDVDVFVHLLNLPVNEIVTPNDDGSYSIFINARLSNDAQLRAYSHALKHIEDNDFNKTDVQTIEMVAHELPVNEKRQVMTASEYEERVKRIKSRRRGLRRKRIQYERKLEFMQEHGYDDFFRYAEQHYLYGDDL